MASQQGQTQPTSQAQRTAEAKAAFTASLKSVGASLDADLQARAKIIHENARELQKQEERAERDLKQLRNQNDEMQKDVDKTKSSLAQYDDLEEIEAQLERDLMTIEETLRIVEDDDWDDYGETEHDSPEAHDRESPAADEVNEPPKSSSPTENTEHERAQSPPVPDK